MASHDLALDAGNSLRQGLLILDPFIHQAAKGMISQEKRSTFTRTLVVGDIHGAHKALLQVLERSSFDRENDRLISLGDLMDYHPDNALVIETLLSMPHLVAVRGNHDIWVHEYLQTGEPDLLWLNQGGAATTASLHSLPLEKLESYRQFFANQVRYFVDESNRLFVHAGFAPEITLEMQTDLQLFWERKFWTMVGQWGNDIGPWPVHSFHEVYLGHSPTNKSWPEALPVHFGNVWNLDQGVKREGRLTIMDVATKAYWQSDFAKDLYPD